MRQWPLLVVKSNDVRPPGDIATQHALDVPPRTFLVAKGKQRCANQRGRRSARSAQAGALRRSAGIMVELASMR